MGFAEGIFVPFPYLCQTEMIIKTIMNKKTFITIKAI